MLRVVMDHELDYVFGGAKSQESQTEKMKSAEEVAKDFCAGNPGGEISITVGGDTGGSMGATGPGGMGAQGTRGNEGGVTVTVKCGPGTGGGKG